MLTTSRARSARPVFGVALALLVAVVGGAMALVAQGKKEFSVSAKKYSFSVSGSDASEIRVTQGDLVTIAFSAEDIAHSFTIEEGGSPHYRIDRRADPGKPVTFRFMADKVGTFEIKCNLTIDERCQRDMHAKLVVEPRK